MQQDGHFGQHPSLQQSAVGQHVEQQDGHFAQHLPPLQQTDIEADCDDLLAAALPLSLVLLLQAVVNSATASRITFKSFITHTSGARPL